MGNSNLSGRFKAKRVEWSEIELKIALAYYYFIYQYNTREKDYESFATDLRKMTNNTDLTEVLVLDLQIMQQ